MQATQAAKNLPHGEKWAPISLQAHLWQSRILSEHDDRLDNYSYVDNTQDLTKPRLVYLRMKFKNIWKSRMQNRL